MSLSKRKRKRRHSAILRAQKRAARTPEKSVRHRLDEAIKFLNRSLRRVEMAQKRVDSTNRELEELLAKAA